MANEFKIKNGLISPNLSLTANTNSTSTTSGGTLTVTGGAAVSQDLYVGGTLFATVSNVANLSGGVASQIPYQSAPNTTEFIPNGTAGTILTSNGTSVPTWNSTINGVSIGGTTRSTGAFTTLTADNAVTFTAGTSSPNTTTGTLVVTGGVGISENLNVGGSLTLTGDLTVNGTTVTINSTTLTVDDKNIELGSVATPNDTTADGGGITLKGATDKTLLWLNSTGRWTFNQPIEASSIQNTAIGSTTRSTGAFTTLTADNAVTFTQNTGSTSTTSGTLVVTGGAGISENLYVGGDGFFGQALNFTPTNANLKSAGDVNSFFQIAVQNKNAGATATGDVVVFANNGDNTSGWIDMGITSSGYNDPTYSLSGPGDGYLYVNGKTSGVGALVISTYTAKDIIFSTNGGATANEIGRWKHNQGLTIKSTTANEGIDTGALQVAGGAYVAGNLYVGGTINLSGVAVQQIGQITTTAAGWNLP